MSKSTDKINTIIETLVAGKPVADKSNEILYIKGFVLGTENQTMSQGSDFDFDELIELTPYVSAESREIERLTKLLEAKEALILELQKPTKQSA